MDTFRLERTTNRDRDLTFTGVKLADQTSHTPGKAQWTELRLYRTDTGRYVIQAVGRSELPGQVDRHTVTVVDNPEAMVAAMRQTGDAGPYLTIIALDALDEAAATDPAVAAVTEERV